MTLLSKSLFCVTAFLFPGGAAGASPYVGAGAAATMGSGHPVLAAGYRANDWRAEVGGYLFDRTRGKNLPAGSLGPTITAERFELKTRLFYADVSRRLRRRDSEAFSGLELGLGTALLRVVKDTRIQRNGGLPEIYSHDVAWRLFPLFRLAFVKPVHPCVTLGLDGRFVMTGDRHGGKNVGGWSLALTARFSPFSQPLRKPAGPSRSP